MIDVNLAIARRSRRILDRVGHPWRRCLTTLYRRARVYTFLSMVTSNSSSSWSGSALNTRPLLYSEKLRVAIQLLPPRVTRWPHRRWNMSNAGHRVSRVAPRRAVRCAIGRRRSWSVDMPGARAPLCAAHRRPSSSAPARPASFGRGRAGKKILFLLGRSPHRRIEINDNPLVPLNPSLGSEGLLYPSPAVE